MRRSSASLVLLRDALRTGYAAEDSVDLGAILAIADMLDIIIPNIRRLEAAADALAIEHHCRRGSNIVPLRQRDISENTA